MGNHLESLGQRIRDVRQAQNLTIEKLSELIGKSDNFVGNIERGESTTSLPTLIDVANALNVGTDTLLQDYLTVFDSQQGAKPQHPLVYKVESMTAEEQKTVWAMIDLMMQFKNN